MSSTTAKIKGNYALLLQGNQALTPVFGSTMSVFRNVLYDEDGHAGIHLAVRLDSLLNVTNLVVVETLPSGVSPNNINNGGIYDAVANTITWTFENPSEQAYLLSYSPKGSRGGYSLSGQATWATYDDVSSTSSESQTAVVGDTEFYIYDLLSGLVYGALTIHRVIESQLVYLHVVPGSATTSQTIVELLPTGLTPYDISDGGVYNSTAKTVTWGPFADHASRSLSYKAKGSDGLYSYASSGSYAQFGTSSYNTVGDDELTIGGVYISDEEDRPVARSVNRGTGTVTIKVVPINGIGSQKIIETIDTSIEIYSISHGGTWDSDTGQVTWVLNDNSSRELSYRYRRDGDGDGSYNEDSDSGAYSVTGTYQFDASYGTIKGSDRLVIGSSVLGDGSLCSRAINGVAVSIKIAPSEDGLRQKVYEELPEGITPSAISDNGVWDATTRRIYWGVFSGATWRTLTYTVTGDAGKYTLYGWALFDDEKFVTVGASKVTIIDATETDSSGNKTTSTYPSDSTDTSSTIAPSATYPTNTTNGDIDNSKNISYPSTSSGESSTTPALSSSYGGGGDGTGNSTGGLIAGGKITPVWSLSISFATLISPNSHLCEFDESSFTSYTID